jgi:hypothetical protein
LSAKSSTNCWNLLNVAISQVLLIDVCSGG